MKKNIIKVQRYRDIVKKYCGCEHNMMVNNFYQKIGKEIFQKRERIRNSIETIYHWEKERQKIKENFEQAIGEKFPKKDVKIVYNGEIKKQNLLVKKIVFSLHDDHWVPALIYMPLEGKGPFPGILLPIGHNIEGKSAYNNLAVFYALNGYVVITYDFVGQGERALMDEDGFVYAFSSTAHNIIGVPMTLYDYNLNWFTIYETVAAVDVLQSTGIVDMSKIGITGASGGGTNSFYSAGFDQRISATAPAASVHSFYDCIYTDDCEQSFFNHIEKGLDYPDIASFLIAPRPMFIVANSHDIWNIEGTKYVYETAKKFYRMHNAETRIKMTISDRGHAYGIDQQTDVLMWFNNLFKNKREFVPYEEIEKRYFPSVKQLYVFPDNKQKKFYLKNPLYIFNKNLEPVKKIDNRYIQNIRKQLNNFVNKKPRWKIIDRYPIADKDYFRIVYCPEKGILLPAEIVKSKKTSGVIILLDGILRTEKPEKHISLSYKDLTVIRPDLRGYGESSPKESWPDWENWCQGNFSGKSFNLFILCHLLGRYIPVERAKDIICLVSIAKEISSEKIIVHSYSSTVISAILAGIVDKRIEELILEGFLYSYKGVFDCGFPIWKADSYLEGCLKAGFDIKQICGMVKARKIEFRNPLDGIMKPVKDRNIKREELN
ncbi:MAG TPA: acetylxylan esterase [bacterium]|jgi:hypothetical protein|nr:acetylxylan esterase [bacterium]HRV03902.1 acetylxylan esterase [Candidatus Ratteibacteria bacterium]